MIIAISIITAYADYLMKVAGSEKNLNAKNFILAMTLYLITGICWYPVMKLVKLSSVGIIYGVTTTLMLAAFGVFALNEKLSGIEIIAIVMGLVSIIILAPKFN